MHSKSSRLTALVGGLAAFLVLIFIGLFLNFGSGLAKLGQNASSITSTSQQTTEQMPELVSAKRPAGSIATVEAPLPSGETKIYEVAYPDGTQTALQILQKLDQESEFSFSVEENPSFGAFIITVNGKSADAKSEFWEFLVNGKQADKGISAYELKPGDKITLKLTKFN